VCSSVGVCVCVFDILIILHHIITSFRITSHHTSYCINDTRIECGADLRKMLRQNENVLRHEVSFGKYSFISPITRRDLSLRRMDIFLYEVWIFLFTKHEKKGRCFLPKAQNGMYVSFMHYKEISYNNLHIRFKVTHIKYHSFVTMETYSSFICYIHQAFQNVYYNKIYSSLRTFSATLFSNLLMTLSTMDSAMFMMSSASFISRSARGSYGSGDGGSSAEVGKINKFEATNQVLKLKSQKKIIHIRFSRSAVFSARFASARASWVSCSLFL
jgi:hypothetical protein